MAEENDMEFFEASACTGENVDLAFTIAANLAVPTLSTRSTVPLQSASFLISEEAKSKKTKNSCKC
jgi:hypothetical protein